MVQRAQSRLGANAPTLGFLVDRLEDGYQSAVAEGVLKSAKDAGANVLCFVGGWLACDEQSAQQRNHVYELATSSTVDGLVILAGTLANRIGTEALGKYCERYRPMPMCSVGARLAPIPSVLIDNEVGMRIVIEHLMETHGCKRLAFVRGPLANAEAELRFRVYREVLAAHGIPFDERLVVTGDFQAQSGRAAVSCLFDERRLTVSDIDAIVVSNDNMAFGVLETLLERGIRVPTDIAVTGFDDVEEARYQTPGLTTVRQPLAEQGREAVRKVLFALQRKAPPEDSQLRTELVIRGSCGCSGMFEHAPPSTSDSLRLGFEAALVSRRQRILAELARAARGCLVHAGANWETRLVTAIADELRGEKRGTLLQLFEGFVLGLVERGMDIGTSHDVLDALRREILACLYKEPERRAQAEDLFQDVRQVIGKTTERLLGASRLRLEYWARQLSTVGARLIGSFDLGDLRMAVTEGFPRLGIASCFVVLYDKGEIPPRFSDLVLAYDSRSDRTLAKSRQFATVDLLPVDVIGRDYALRNFVVAPLFFKNETFGYVVLEFDIAQTFAYEAIRDLISAALKGARLVSDVKTQRAELDTALGLVRDEELRHLACLEQMQQVSADITSGALKDPKDIKERLERVLAGL